MTDKRIEAAAKQAMGRWLEALQTDGQKDVDLTLADLFLKAARLGAEEMFAAAAQDADEARELVEQIERVTLTPCGTQTMLRMLGMSAAFIERIMGLKP